METSDIIEKLLATEYAGQELDYYDDPCKRGYYAITAKIDVTTRVIVGHVSDECGEGLEDTDREEAIAERLSDLLSSDFFGREKWLDYVSE